MTKTYKTRTLAAKAYAAANGYYGKAGGWIYNKNGESLYHGWAAFAGSLARRRIIIETDERWAPSETYAREREETWERLIYGGKTKAEWAEALPAETRERLEEADLLPREEA